MSCCLCATSHRFADPFISSGGAVGGAAAGAIWSTLLPARLASHLPADSLALIPDIMASLPYTLTFEMGTPVRTAINAAYVETQQRLNIVAIIILFPALACVCAMKNTHLDLEDQGQGEGVVVLGRASFLGMHTASPMGSRC